MVRHKPVSHTPPKCLQLETNAWRLLASAPHVRLADKAVFLDGQGSKAYLDSHKIIEICREHGVDAVVPGYGFLSENSEFVQLLQQSNIIFVGPTAETIETFGLKHSARKLAVKAEVPVLPGTDLISATEEALEHAERLGYPIMVKATAGGGGMGLVVCHSSSELEDAIATVRSRGQALFKDAAFFLEKYVEHGRHIEGQIFGNGLGDVLWFGERECSIQRRHQKVLEESPSPFVIKHPELRNKLRQAACSLAASVKYRSVGTVEFLVDDATGAFYFLEMNTRLQVEHGVTELVYGVDLVHLMLLQADAEFSGQRGLTDAALSCFLRSDPSGHAVEVRVYAENPAKDFRPAPGMLTNVKFPEGHGIRVDTWVDSGTLITPAFDPLIAKVMVYASTRSEALNLMSEALSRTVLCGPPTNVDFLIAIVQHKDVKLGYTTTNLLDTRFQYQPWAIDIHDGGMYTTVQDLPGRQGFSNGIPVAGPMDSVSMRIANMLVGNNESTEVLEITYGGPRFTVHGGAVIALCGAEFDFSIDSNPASLWTRHVVQPGSKIEIGNCHGHGYRAYLAFLGGLPNVGKYLGSKSTTPSLNWGGYQGRTIRAGDFLGLQRLGTDKLKSFRTWTLSEAQRPRLEDIFTIQSLPGPYDSDEFLAQEGRKEFYNTVWKVAFNSSRTGVRLEGPPPKWSRTDGKEGGSHPSNMLGFGYPIGGMSFTGDAAVVFSSDSPGQSGFICIQTVITSQLWKLGQLAPGNEVRFSACSWEDAMAAEKTLEVAMENVRQSVQHGSKLLTSWSDPAPFKRSLGTSVLYERPEGNSQGLPRFVVRQAGDRALLCDYGSQAFDLNLRARAQELILELRHSNPLGFHHYCRPHTNSVLMMFDPSVIDQKTAVSTLIRVEASLADVRRFSAPSRIYHLPLLFDAQECMDANQKYMETQRPYARYLPDNVDFIRRNNGLETRNEVLNSVAEKEFLVLTSGGMMGLPICVQVDPRSRLVVPKSNPSRTTTPGGAVGLGGMTCSIYPCEQPGGYLLMGLTIPGSPFDIFGTKPGFTAEKPWLFDSFDRIVFHSVTRQEFDDITRRFQLGLYEIPSEDSVFDLAIYNDLIDETREEVAKIQERQRRCAAVESEMENELLRRWAAEKATKAAQLAAEKSKAIVHEAANLERITATMNARVWKVVKEVDTKMGASVVILILEAMKMEIAVSTPQDHERYRLAKILVEEGDMVSPGDVLALVEPVQA